MAVSKPRAFRIISGNTFGLSCSDNVVRYNACLRLPLEPEEVLAVELTILRLR